MLPGMEYFTEGAPFHCLSSDECINHSMSEGGMLDGFDLEGEKFRSMEADGKGKGRWVHK